MTTSFELNLSVFDCLCKPHLLTEHLSPSSSSHQIRVAAKSSSIPILGDDRYGGGSLDIYDSSADWNRTYLHATAIHLELDDNEHITIWSPPPFDHLFADGELKDVFVSLMKKHCDCSPILDTIALSDKDNTS